MRLRFGYKFVALLLILIVTAWLSLMIFFSKSREIELRGLPKSMIEWFISSDNTKISIGSSRLIIDRDNFLDRLVLNDIVLIRKDLSDPFGNISEIQVRFDSKSLIQRLSTPLAFIFNDSEIFMVKIVSDMASDMNKIPASDNVSASEDDLLEYFISMFNGGMLYFKNADFINTTLNFASSHKTDKVNIRAAQLYISDDNKMHGKVFYKFNKLEHHFDIIASYSDGVNLMINCNFQKLPAHLVLSQLSGNISKNFQNDHNFLEVSASMEFFFDRKLNKYYNKLHLLDMSGKLYFPNSKSEFIKIDSAKINLDFSNSWYSLKDLRVKFNDNSSLIMKSDIVGRDIDNLNIQMVNFPISSYKFVNNIAAVEDVSDFFNTYFPLGNLNGEVSLKLLKDFWKNQKFDKSFIKSNIKITGAEYRLDEEYLPVRNINAVMDIQNDNVSLEVLSGKLGNSHIEKCVVSLNILELPKKKNSILINGQLKGEAADLVTFIDKESMEKLTESDIDLSKLNGKAITNINVKTSIHKDLEEIYDIKSLITNVDLNIFNDIIKVRSGEFDCTFDGNKFILKGKSKINDQKSYIDYLYDYDESCKFDNILKVNMGIKSDFSTLLQVYDGKADLNFELLSKNNYITYSAKSDFSKLDFAVEKIGMIKPKGVKSKLIFNGLSNDKENNASLILSADNGIDIKANIDFKDGVHISSNNFKYEDTSLNLRYEEKNNNARLNVEGTDLNLREAKLSKLFSKESGDKSSDTVINVDNVYFKENVSLNDLKVHISCDKIRCVKGDINASIDNSKEDRISISIQDNNDEETWIIRTNNLGRVFNIFSLNNLIKGGLLEMRLKTVRDLNKIDQQISITKSVFKVKDLYSIGNSFALKMISFLSFPGLTGAVLNNDIQFKEVNGRFEYKDDILTFANGMASGPVFDFTFQGGVDMYKREYSFRGRVIPSLFGINQTVKWILEKAPVIGKLFSYGRRKGLFMAPYRISEKY